jgi:hypothetical protein
MPQRQCSRAISRRDEVGFRVSYRDASAGSQRARRPVWAVGRLGLTVGEPSAPRGACGTCRISIEPVSIGSIVGHGFGGMIRISPEGRLAGWERSNQEITPGAFRLASGDRPEA